MRPQKQFKLSQRPVMSTSHGGFVHQSWDWVVHHKLLAETVAVVAAAGLLLLIAYGLQLQMTAANVALPANAEAVYRELHSYDAIEDARALRLVNPRPVADRSYDTIEIMRAQRLVLQGDHSYDGVEDVRANRLINPVVAPDHSYDAIEDLRANRDLGQ